MEFFLSNSLSIVLYLSISILENRLSSDAPGYTHIDDDAAPWYFQLNLRYYGLMRTEDRKKFSLLEILVNYY